MHYCFELLDVLYHNTAVGKKAIMHKVITILASFKNYLLPGPNHLLTTGADDTTL